MTRSPTDAVPGAGARPGRRRSAGAVRQFFLFAGIHGIAELGSMTVALGAALAWTWALRRSGLPEAVVQRRVAAVAVRFFPLAPHRVPIRRRHRALPGRHALAPDAARALLGAPPSTTLRGMRDGAILSLSLEAGLRAGWIVRLRVRDLRLLDSLRPLGLGDNAVGERAQKYVEAAGHGFDLAGPLFRPVVGGGSSPARPISTATINHILAKYLRELGIAGSYGSQSLHLSSIATALTAGASVEEVRRALSRARAVIAGGTGSSARREPLGSRQATPGGARAGHWPR